MSILLAVCEPNFVGILRSNFVLGGLEVIDNDVYHRNYLLEIIELEKPSVVVIHDTYLPSDHGSPKEKDDEMLEMLTYLRTTYDSSIRIVYLCERDRKDPFLGSLVARNVLDIFNERRIETSQFIQQIKDAPRFSNVAKFGIGPLEVEFEDEPIAEEFETSENTNQLSLPVTPPRQEEKEKGSSLLSQVADKAKQTVQAGTEWHQQWQEDRANREKVERPPKEKKTPRMKSKVEVTSESDEVLDLMPIAKEVYMREPVIGTVVIGVAGVTPHIGCTHTAMTIASYLHQRKHSVALIELNASEDFDRIHSLYEGEKNYIRHVTNFDYKGIDHYKYREDIRLGEIMATYEYVVLDFGTLDEHPYHSEYIRSHIRLAVTSPFEWKQHWTDQFCEGVPDPEHHTFIVPFAEKANVKDMQERLPELNILPFPASKNPYTVEDPADIVIQQLMKGFLHDAKRSFSRKTVLVASLASAVVTSMVIGLIVLL